MLSDPQPAARQGKEKGLRILTFLFIIFILIITFHSSFAQDIYPLFTIERSLNKNVLHYDAKLAKNGDLDADEPVIVYWIMLAEDGHREPLSFIEKQRAYGFSIKSEKRKNYFSMYLAADKNKKITVYKDNDKIRAETRINGRQAYLDKIYVSSNGSLLTPKITYLELHGRDIRTGNKVFEKIIPD